LSFVVHKPAPAATVYACCQSVEAINEFVDVTPSIRNVLFKLGSFFWSCTVFNRTKTFPEKFVV